MVGINYQYFVGSFDFEDNFADYNHFDHFDIEEHFLIEKNYIVAYLQIDFEDY